MGLYSLYNRAIICEVAALGRVGVYAPCFYTKAVTNQGELIRKKLGKVIAVLKI